MVDEEVNYNYVYIKCILSTDRWVGGNALHFFNLFPTEREIIKIIIWTTVRLKETINILSRH